MATSIVLKTLLALNFEELQGITSNFEARNRTIKVPNENSPTTLHMFNMQLSELHTDVEYELGRARGYRDAIARLIDAVLKDNYVGKNELERKAAGYRFCRQYPTDGYHYENSVNLFDLEFQINEFYNSLDSSVKILHAKSSARITSNSLLNIDRALTTN